MESSFGRSVKRKLNEVDDDNRPQVAACDDVTATVEVSNELCILRETLANQHNTIQNLILELDEERSAASTATNEAMSMILRLQREKAEIQMEYRQFKSFAEERIAHDHQELVELDDLLLTKDEDIKELKNQLTRYRNCKDSDGFGDYSRLKCTNPDERYEDCEKHGDDDCGSSVFEKYSLTTMDQLHTLESTIYEMEVEKKPEVMEPDSEFSDVGDHDLEADDENEDDDESARVYTIDAVHQVSNTEEGGNKGEKFGGDGDIKKLYMRLQALEADRESTRQVVLSMKTEKAQLVLLKEIAQQLCKEAVPEKKVVKKQSLIARFSVVTVIKIFRSKLQVEPWKYAFISFTQNCKWKKGIYIQKNLYMWHSNNLDLLESRLGFVGCLRGIV